MWEKGSSDGRGESDCWWCALAVGSASGERGSETGRRLLLTRVSAVGLRRLEGLNSGGGVAVLTFWFSSAPRSRVVSSQLRRTIAMELSDDFLRLTW